jgi:hypothetical protein
VRILNKTKEVLLNRQIFLRYTLNECYPLLEEEEKRSEPFVGLGLLKKDQTLSCTPALYPSDVFNYFPKFKKNFEIKEPYLFASFPLKGESQNALHLERWFFTVYELLPLYKEYENSHGLFSKDHFETFFRKFYTSYFEVVLKAGIHNLYLVFDAHNHLALYKGELQDGHTLLTQSQKKELYYSVFLSCMIEKLISLEKIILFVPDFEDYITLLNAFKTLLSKYPSVESRNFHFQPSYDYLESRV